MLICVFSIIINVTLFDYLIVNLSGVNMPITTTFSVAHESGIRIFKSEKTKTMLLNTNVHCLFQSNFTKNYSM